MVLLMLSIFYFINFDLSNSGFNANGLISKFTTSKYQIGVIITNLKNNKSGMVLTDKYFEKK
mgnify:CR=1 FL=1